MFRKVLDYTFRRVPIPIDVSGRGTHGTATAVDFDPDGAQVESGALIFAHPGSRVRVHDRNPFFNLRAVKIEVLAKIESVGVRQNLTEGHLSFAFFIQPDGSLSGTALGVDGNGQDAWLGANSVVDSPDGIARTVPLNTWVTLTYVHDGFATLRLFINGVLVAANYTLNLPLRHVGFRGVHIGNWPDADAYPLRGRLDGVTIWGWDPDAAYGQFFGRPTGACWNGIFETIAPPTLDAHGQAELKASMTCQAQALFDIVRQVRGSGEEAIERIAAYSRAYRQLWAAGDIGGAAMEQLLAEWIGWLDAHFPVGDWIAALQRCLGDVRPDYAALAGLNWAKCDPQFAAYIQLLMKLTEKYQ